MKEPQRHKDTKKKGSIARQNNLCVFVSLWLVFPFLWLNSWVLVVRVGGFVPRGKAHNNRLIPKSPFLQYPRIFRLVKQRVDQFRGACAVRWWGQGRVRIKHEDSAWKTAGKSHG